MGSDKIHAELKQLRGEVLELRLLLEGVVGAVAGREKGQELLANLETYAINRRISRGTPVYKVGIDRASWRLWDRDLLTVEEVAERSRSEIAAIPGVGRVSMRKLEAALAERGLDFAEPV